ncbi:hypothetical protein M501DRAFT_944710 [Patellaria atrata CBS 101060]|uniref:C2H2-type domain-containing protein n=1 Tax=Patellaria atrata CBS 101060 TaxID=1346257 RepID=A0A9P4S235_9PEZI|nr:hypothetical protein M501DRAFT_944710 [Patellaria atrata CBS 101060]
MDEGSSDLLYKAKLNDNGEYCCPFKEKENCNHKPTYKYLECHIKPYRYEKAASCEKTRFASRSSLLRHDREIHGVGVYLCPYLNCERSKEYEGFRRRSLCDEHMRRVHGWSNFERQSGTPKRRRPDKKGFGNQKVSKQTLPQRRKQAQHDVQ